MKLLYQTQVKNKSYTKLEELYEKDKAIAGIVSRNAPKEACRYETSIIDWEDGSFSCTTQNVFLSISVTNKKYYSKSKITNIAIKKGKLWNVTDSGKHKGVKHLLWSDIPVVFQPFILEKFPMFRFLSENPKLNPIPLNSILGNKLFTPQKCANWLYKTGGKASVDLLTSSSIDLWSWRTILKNKVLFNVNNLNPEHVDFKNAGIFTDTLRLANILRKKVNCAWSLNRMKQEHDDWAKVVTDIIYTETNEALDIAEEYKQFEAVNPEVKLITTTKDLAFEGIEKSHCVAAYVNQINSKSCAIYTIDGYTLQIARDSYSKQLSIAQFRGFRNCEAPIELHESIKNKLITFNEEHKVVVEEPVFAGQYPW